MPTEPNAWTFLKRGFQLRCPECGISPVFLAAAQVRGLKQWMQPLPGCPVCGYAYEREPGYFLLSIWAINYGVMGALGLASLFLVDGIFHPPHWKTMCIVFPVLSVISIIFVRYAKSLFLALDHYCDPHVTAIK